MAKRWNKALAFALALCMCAGSMNVSAWATTTTETVDNGDGTTTAITTTTEEKTDAEKNLTVTVTVEKHTEGTLEDDTTVDGVELVRDEKRVDTTTTSEDGDLLGESWEEGGKETKEWSEEIKPGEDVPPVSAPVTPDDPATEDVNEGITSGKVHSKTEETTGDTDKSDGEWDFTTTTTEIDREVDVTASEVTVTESEKTDVDLEPIAPELLEVEDGVFSNGYYEDGTPKADINSPSYYDNDIVYGGTVKWNSETQQWEAVNWSGKGDYRFLGYGEESAYKALHYDDVTYEVDEDGKLKLDENGNPIIIDYDTDDAWLGQFTLHDEDGNIVYAYCVDLETGADLGDYYDVANLEDNTYYADENSADHIRAIVTNGYWGTNAIEYETNEDGTVKTDENGLAIPKKDNNGNVIVDKTKTGSLEKIKHDMADYLSKNPGKDISVAVATVDEEGNPTTMEVKLSELMKDLTEGEALAATQVAIWTYANGSGEILNGEASDVVLGKGGFITRIGSGQCSAESSARLDALYEYLINLSEPKHTETTVIDKDTFIEEGSMQLTVKDKAKETITDESGEVKVEDYAENIDDNANNDIYNVDLSFKLIVEPGANDDLILYLMDNNNNIIRKSRLAGDDTNDDETFTPLVFVDGSYVFENLQLAENSDVKFNVKLSGTQKLEQGVYVYSPVGGRKSSQTMIGMGEGTKSVDVQASVTVNFSVDESKKVTTVREWHDESDPVWTPTEKPEYPEEDEHDDDKDIPDEDVPLVDIPDEEIPLASVPQTGVNNTPWSLMVAAAGLALAAVLGKKNK